MPLTGEIHLLPPKGRRGRSLALAFLFTIPFIIGALAVALGQDANWDLRNYHWYNAYAFLNGRHGFDILPSQTPYFYNPILDVPFYLLATHAPAMITGYILGFVQGLNAVLLFMLAHASLIIPNPRSKVLVCVALAALGVLGGGGIAQIGTTFYDNITSLGLFASALLTVRYQKILMTAALPKISRLAFLFGIPAGLMMGLKLPSVVFCVGLCFAFLLTGGAWQRRFVLSFAFGLGVLAGWALSYGYWGWFLQTHFGSPFFPYFNNYFHAPLAPMTSARDTQYVPHSWQEWFSFPYLLTRYPHRVGEIDWRDWRIFILYILLPLAVVLRLVFGRTRNRTEAIAMPFASRYLLWVGVLSYLAWLAMFGIYRYALPLEMLAPLLIVFATGLLPLKMPTRALLAGMLLVMIAFSVQPGNWTRREHWLDRFVEAKIPDLSRVKDPMILMAGFEPYSHLVTQFPPQIPFIRIQSNFSSPDQDKAINWILKERVAAHQGAFLLLIPPWQHDLAKSALKHFNLGFSAGPCQKVVDRLYQDSPMDLCRIERRR